MIQIPELIGYSIGINIPAIIVGCVLATLPQLKGREDIVMTATSIAGTIGLIMSYIGKNRMGEGYMFTHYNVTMGVIMTMCVCSACAWLRRKKG